MNVNVPLDLLDEFNVHPDIHLLFQHYSELYFDKELGTCSVEWSSRRMTRHGPASQRMTKIWSVHMFVHQRDAAHLSKLYILACALSNVEQLHMGQCVEACIASHHCSFLNVYDD